MHYVLSNSYSGIEKVKARQKQRFLDVTLNLSMTTMLVFEIYLGSKYIYNHTEKTCSLLEINGMLYDTFLIYGTAFVILGTCFAMFGILTISSLKQNFRNFYEDNFWYCVIATVGLSIPLIFRGVLDILKGSHK